MGPREVPWPKAAAEGCEVLRPSKAAAEVLRVLRLSQNVAPREVPSQSKWDACESCCGRL